MVSVGPLERVPSWAIMLVLLATTFYVVREEPFPTAYGVFGVSVPLQTVIATVIVILTVAAVYNGTYPFLLDYFDRE